MSIKPAPMPTPSNALGGRGARRSISSHFTITDTARIQKRMRGEKEDCAAGNEEDPDDAIWVPRN
jgi:hypothetical protein